MAAIVDKVKSKGLRRERNERPKLSFTEQKLWRSTVEKEIKSLDESYVLKMANGFFSEKLIVTGRFTHIELVWSQQGPRDGAPKATCGQTRDGSLPIYTGSAAETSYPALRCKEYIPERRNR